MSKNDCSTAQVLTRDRRLQQLLGLVRSHPGAARDQGTRIRAALTRFIDDRNRDHRLQVEQKVKLLDVARDMARKPDEMMKPSGVFVGPPDYPKGSNPLTEPTRRELAVWENRAFNALGFYDHGVGLAVQFLRDEFKFASDADVKLNHRSALKSYVLAVVHLSKRKRSEESIRAELDPAAATEPGATDTMGLATRLLAELDRPVNVVRTLPEQWHLAILLLLAHVAEFDGSDVGIIPGIRWDDPADEWNPFIPRKLTLDHCSTIDGRHHELPQEDQLAFLLESVTDNLSAWSERELPQPAEDSTREGEASSSDLHSTPCGTKQGSSITILEKGAIDAAHRPGIQVTGITHGDDFTWLQVHGKVYHFKKGNQARTIQFLFGMRVRSGDRDGTGAGEEAIADAIGSSSNQFRVQKVFEGHPALGAILRPSSKGVYALFLDAGQQAETHEKGHF